MRVPPHEHARALRRARDHPLPDGLSARGQDRERPRPREPRPHRGARAAHPVRVLPELVPDAAEDLRRELGLQARRAARDPAKRRSPPARLRRARGLLEGRVGAYAPVHVRAQPGRHRRRPDAQLGQRLPLALRGEPRLDLRGPERHGGGTRAWSTRRRGGGEEPCPLARERARRAGPDGRRDAAPGEQDPPRRLRIHGAALCPRAHAAPVAPRARLVARARAAVQALPDGVPLRDGGRLRDLAPRRHRERRRLPRGWIRQDRSPGLPRLAREARRPPRDAGLAARALHLRLRLLLPGRRRREAALRRRNGRAHADALRPDLQGRVLLQDERRHGRRVRRPALPRAEAARRAVRLFPQGHAARALRRQAFDRPCRSRPAGRSRVWRSSGVRPALRLQGLAELAECAALRADRRRTGAAAPGRARRPGVVLQLVEGATAEDLGGHRLRHPGARDAHRHHPLPVRRAARPPPSAPRRPLAGAQDGRGKVQSAATVSFQIWVKKGT